MNFRLPLIAAGALSLMAGLGADVFAAPIAAIALMGFGCGVLIRSARAEQATFMAMLATIALFAVPAIQELAGQQGVLFPSRLLVASLLWTLAMFHAGLLRPNSLPMRDTVDRMASAIALVKADGTILYGNTALGALFAQDTTSLIGSSLSQYVRINEDNKVRLQPLLRDLATERGTFAVEAQRTPAQPRQGHGQLIEPLPLTMTVSPPRGAAAAWVEFSIPPRREEKNTAELLLRYSSEFAVLLEPNGQVRAATPCTCLALDRGNQPLLSGSFVDFVHIADRDRVSQGISDAQQLELGANKPLGRVRLHRQDGRLMHIDAVISRQGITPESAQVIVNGRDITDRVSSEEAYRNLESQFAAVYQASRDAIVMARADDYTVLDVNEGFSRVFHMHRNDVIGFNFADLPLWSDASAATSHLKRVRREGYLIDDRMPLKDASARRIEAMISTRFMELKGELALITVIRDVTDSEETLAALKESEQKFQRVFNNAPDGIVIQRLSDNVILDVNDHFCHASGYDRSELIGQTPTELGAIAQPEQRVRSLELLHRYGLYHDVEVEFIAKSGERIPTLVSACTTNLNGDVCIIAVLKDLRAFRRMEKALRDSETRFRNTFENAPMGIALVSLDLHISECNLWFAEVVGRRTHELTGSRLADIAPEEERGSIERTLKHLIENNREPARREITIVRRNDERRSIRLHAAYQKGIDGGEAYLIVQIVDVTDIRRSQEQMERMAFYDPLTDLANRRLLMDRLEHTLRRAQRSGKPGALFYLDLDQFKRINDTLGHDAGDDLLRTVAKRLRECVRREDTVARPGGDEFNILLSDVRDTAAAAHVAEHVLSVMRQPIQLGKQSITVTTSIGIAMLPEDGSEAAQLVQRADHAMYRAKQRGRNTYCFVVDHSPLGSTKERGLEAELSDAIVRDELRLLFQPVYELHNQLITSAEVLVRWRHPTRGVLEPAAFVTPSEHTALAVALDHWVLNKACEQLQAMRSSQRHLQTPVPIPALSINLSRRNLTSGAFRGELTEAVERFGLQPQQIQLELSERHLLRDLNGAALWIAEMGDVGFDVTIDDFGSESSSISLLTKLAARRVKLDNTVVAKLPHSKEAIALLRALTTAARILGMDVIAEGVETAAQRDTLLEHGCDLAQGYLFAPPIDGANLLGRLSSPGPFNTHAN